MNSCGNFELLFLNIQCRSACSLERWTLKFKLVLYRISCFNYIYIIYCANTLMRSDGLAQIRATIFRIQIFSR